jgi:ribosomal subunit interface protein
MMLINIQSRQFSLSSALSDYVKSKIRVKLGRYETKLSKIDVILFDVNGPKGGEDKCCKIMIRLNNSPSIVVQETAEDLYAGINTCALRARRAVDRQLSVSSRARRKLRNMLLMPSQDELTSDLNSMQ